MSASPPVDPSLGAYPPQRWDDQWGLSREQWKYDGCDMLGWLTARAYYDGKPVIFRRVDEGSYGTMEVQLDNVVGRAEVVKLPGDEGVRDEIAVREAIRDAYRKYEEAPE